MQLACSDIVSGVDCTYVGTADSPALLHGALVAHIDLAHFNLTEGSSPESLQDYHEEIDRRVLERIAALN